MIKVVHCQKQTYDILIDRTTMWGNPFHIGKDGNRSDVMNKFFLWITGRDYKNFKQKERQLILDNMDELRNKVLACWCKPMACHGDIYKEILEDKIHGILQM